MRAPPPPILASAHRTEPGVSSPAVRGSEADRSLIVARRTRRFENRLRTHRNARQEARLANLLGSRNQNFIEIAEITVDDSWFVICHVALRREALRPW